MEAGNHFDALTTIGKELLQMPNISLDTVSQILIYAIH